MLGQDDSSVSPRLRRVPRALSALALLLGHADPHAVSWLPGFAEKSFALVLEHVLADSPALRLEHAHPHVAALDPARASFAGILPGLFVSLEEVVGYLAPRWQSCVLQALGLLHLASASAVARVAARLPHPYHKGNPSPRRPTYLTHLAILSR